MGVSLARRCPSLSRNLSQKVKCAYRVATSRIAASWTAAWWRKLLKLTDSAAAPPTSQPRLRAKVFDISGKLLLLFVSTSWNNLLIISDGSAEKQCSAAGPPSFFLLITFTIHGCLSNALMDTWSPTHSLHIEIIILTLHPGTTYHQKQNQINQGSKLCGSLYTVQTAVRSGRPLWQQVTPLIKSFQLLPSCRRCRVPVERIRCSFQTCTFVMNVYAFFVCKMCLNGIWECVCQLYQRLISVTIWDSFLFCSIRKNLETTLLDKLPL